MAAPMLMTSNYTHLAFQLTGLLDQGETLNIAQTRQHITDGSLFGWLEATYGDRVDLGLIDADDRAAVCEAFRDFVMVGNSWRRYLVEHNGLALLVAYCLEGAQRAATD
jgi:hypothetical protein